MPGECLQPRDPAEPALRCCQRAQAPSALVVTPAVASGGSGPAGGGGTFRSRVFESISFHLPVSLIAATFPKSPSSPVKHVEESVDVRRPLEGREVPHHLLIELHFAGVGARRRRPTLQHLFAEKMQAVRREEGGLDDVAVVVEQPGADDFFLYRRLRRTRGR